MVVESTLARVSAHIRIDADLQTEPAIVELEIKIVEIVKIKR
jgi:hypothetical protein